MFREDADYVKRTIAVGLIVLCIFGLFFYAIIRSHEEDAQTRRARISVCQSIRSETVRRDCLLGPQQQVTTIYPH